MYYICIENQAVVSVLNYQPQVPDSVEVIEITDDEYSKIHNQTHYFDVTEKSIVPVPETELEKKEIEKQNVEPREFLNSTDWMVLRHLRQRALNIETSLTEDAYIELEKKRDKAARKIK